ncbi:MAG: glycosyltransferase family 2 protein [Candidatus Helarchaeota archaeon]
MRSKISIVIPAYNEEKTIGELIKGICCKFNSDSELIIVDDGSTDRTSECANINGTKIIRNERNLGYGGALIRGINHATGDIIVTIDGDAQNKPEEINRLIRPILRGEADFVVGSRHLGTANAPIPLFKKMAERVVYYIIKFVLRTEITYSQSGFRAIKRKVLNAIMPLTEKKFAFSMDILIKAIKKGFRVKEVPITIMARPHGNSRVNVLKDGIRIVWVLIKNIIRGNGKK